MPDLPYEGPYVLYETIISISNFVSFFIRNMHYPPETASVMLIAQMIATVLQVCCATTNKVLCMYQRNESFSMCDFGKYNTINVKT